MNISLISSLVVFSFWAASNAGFALSSPFDALILASQSSSKRPAASARQTAEAAPLSRSDMPIVTVSTTGDGQAGYVHYFVITGPDGEHESQVGVELPDHRIAWSFPELGVLVSPFIASGSITAGGKVYDVHHLYGIRPFPDQPTMRKLQQELTARVTPWIDQKIRYCDEERPPNQVCVSCLGFVLRVLYPSPSSALGAVPVLPPDFKSTRKNLYTTEDFLLYLAGVPLDAPREARLVRIEALAIPQPMREQLIRISNASESLPRSESKTANGKARAPARETVDLPNRALAGRRS